MTNSSDRADIDDAREHGALWAALGGCWDGIALADIGRTVQTATQRLHVAEYCTLCPRGRLQLDGSVLRCNHCGAILSRQAEFIEPPKQLDEVAAALAHEVMCLEQLARVVLRMPEQTAKMLGRPWWCLVPTESSRERRIVFEGQSCPVCPAEMHGTLFHFVAPGSEEQTLICSSPMCKYSLAIVKGVSGADITEHCGLPTLPLPLQQVKETGFVARCRNILREILQHKTPDHPARVPWGCEPDATTQRRLPD